MPGVLAWSTWKGIFFAPLVLALTVAPSSPPATNKLTSKISRLLADVSAKKKSDTRGRGHVRLASSKHSGLSLLMYRWYVHELPNKTTLNEWSPTNTSPLVAVAAAPSW